ncbi:hypothetical protein [Epilithonimonas sp.]|uniref:hypothetical protein n=1 Tax=Epilithonimonas sp. TaxID=2894511 RepID=UPI0035B36460
MRELIFRHTQSASGIGYSEKSLKNKCKEFVDKHLKFDLVCSQINKNEIELEEFFEQKDNESRYTISVYKIINNQ